MRKRVRGVIDTFCGRKGIAQWPSECLAKYKFLGLTPSTSIKHK